MAERNNSKFPIDRVEDQLNGASEEANRTPREIETRELEARMSDSFVPQSTLPVPAPRDGWSFRYIRTAMVGNSDNANVSQRMREGWVPVKAEDHPELLALRDHGSRWPDGIEIGGLLLCKAPTEQVERRNRYYQDLANRQIESVDSQLMRESDARMPINAPERSSRTSFRP